MSVQALQARDALLRASINGTLEKALKEGRQSVLLFLENLL